MNLNERGAVEVARVRGLKSKHVTDFAEARRVLAAFAVASWDECYLLWVTAYFSSLLFTFFNGSQCRLYNHISPRESASKEFYRGTVC